MIGMHRESGGRIADDAHLAQSVADILFTPIGTRVMRRDYGSELPALLDAPISPETVVDLFAAAAEALDRWEPRIRLTRVRLLEATDAGTLGLALDFVRADGSAGTLEVTP